MELLKLPNVRVAEKLKYIAEEQLNEKVKRLAWQVATTNPLWTIEVASPNHYSVCCDGEELGKFGSEWHGVNTKLYVRNHRIEAQNERKSSYHTDKVDKAVLKIKKTFGRKTTAERVNIAMDKADSVIESQKNRVVHRMRYYESDMRESMLKFVSTQVSQYILWLQENKDTAMLEVIKNKEIANADMVTIESVKSALQSNNTALVVIEDGKYIVKVRDNVQLYDDNTLPHELRGKLGMLKLVEKEAMVTGIGCRVSDEIFVLMMEN